MPGRGNSYSEGASLAGAMGLLAAAGGMKQPKLFTQKICFQKPSRMEVEVVDFNQRVQVHCRNRNHYLPMNEPEIYDWFANREIILGAVKDCRKKIRAHFGEVKSSSMENFYVLPKSKRTRLIEQEQERQSEESAMKKKRRPRKRKPQPQTLSSPPGVSPKKLPKITEEVVVTEAKKLQDRDYDDDDEIEEDEDDEEDGESDDTISIHEDEGLATGNKMAREQVSV